jgi:hypothetical protein
VIAVQQQEQNEATVTVSFGSLESEVLGSMSDDAHAVARHGEN